jgi:precorrin-6x reductase
MDDTPTVRLQRPLDSPQYDTWVNEEQDFEQAMERAQRGHVVLSFSWLKPLKR